MPRQVSDCFFRTSAFPTRVSHASFSPPVTELPAFETPLNVIEYPDPRLRAVNAKIGSFDDKLRELAHAMLEVMYQDDGVGLAAPQVSVPSPHRNPIPWRPGCLIRAPKLPATPPCPTQVGVNVRMMVFNPEGEKGKGEEYVLINPRRAGTAPGP